LDDAIVSALAYAIRNAVWPTDCANRCFVAKKQYTYLLTYYGSPANTVIEGQ